MLCSAPIGKSGGSNWLDRLRSTKGIPVGGEDDDLDHFLSRNPNSASSNSPPPPIPTSESTQPRLRQPPVWNAGAVRNVLSELFFVGGSAESSALSGKKLPRKQANPRLCVGSINNGGGNGNSNSTELADQIRTRKKIKNKTNKITKIQKKMKKKKKRKRSDFAAKSPAMVTSDSNSLTPSNKGIEIGCDNGEDEDKDDEEEGETELRGYSRSEVTVIDTSFAVWKAEKLVYRRKNVWKVRDKRGKSKSFLGRTKRKNDDGDQDRGLHCDGKKVEKKRVKVLGQCDNVDQSPKRPSLDEEYHQGLKNNSGEEEDCRAVTTRNLSPSREQVGADSPGNIGQDFKKRPRFFSLPSKLKRCGSSSGLIVKAIHTDRKLTGRPSSSPKPTQKQQHKN